MTKKKNNINTLLSKVTGDLLLKIITNIKNLVTKEHGLTSDVLIMCIITIILTILYNIWF